MSEISLQLIDLSQRNQSLQIQSDEYYKLTQTLQVKVNELKAENARLVAERDAAIDAKEVAEGLTMACEIALGRQRARIAELEQALKAVSPAVERNYDHDEDEYILFRKALKQ